MTGTTVAGDSNKQDRDKRANLDSTGEFFSVGAPLHAVRAGYVRRRADDQLFEVLMAGHFAHVVAPDRSGKSSLVAATAARLESRGRKIAVLDLAQLGDREGGTDAGRWYYSVAYRLLRQLRIRYDLQAWWQDKSILSNRQRLLEFYSEVILQHVDERIVIFVDEIQCIENLGYADQLLVSIRAAHNARTTDPDFSRLSFVLLGECDPVSLMQEAELSPFNVTQQISLEDFTREEIGLFATELNVDAGTAAIALDRIYYWTNGQPYLTQKLARAVARESLGENVSDFVDRIARTQIAGRAALHSEPHMSHIHRAIVNDKKRCEPLLNLYGKIRKGIKVSADLGSELQRRLMAVGLLVIDDESNMAVRNKLYEHVFTARWANENLPTHFKVPAIVALALLLFAMIPFWYTQWLPNPYVRTLADDEVDVATATDAYESFRSFPGHSDDADNLYRNYLERRAQRTSDEAEVTQLSAAAANLPNAGRLADEIVASFWDRQVNAALQVEDRDAALLARLRSLALPTSNRRQRAAALISDDYPFLEKSLPPLQEGEVVFDPASMILSTVSGSRIRQFSYSQQGLQSRESWPVTALEVTPLVRRVIVDREGAVARIGLTLNVSHARMNDLRVKIIAPSGRTVEIETGVERASSNEDIRIPAQQLGALVGESLSGTWSISVRDESLGVAGQLVGWNLKLNSQGAVEYFQRGLNIPDPVEGETQNIWFDPSGHYAVARARQSDSARIWDLAFAEPVRAIPLPESERLIGLDASSHRLVTASLDKVSLWDTTSGDKLTTLDVGAASSSAMLTPDRMHLFVAERGDTESRLETWNLEDGVIAAEVVVAGSPALVAIDGAGQRIAVADFDRAVRIWDAGTNELLAQIDLPAQPSEIKLSANGETLGVVFANAGVAIWSVASPQSPLLEEFGGGTWQLAFSSSGNVAAAGRPATGFQVINTSDGSLNGPRLGVRQEISGTDLLAFSDDEQILVTGSAAEKPRIWRLPTASTVGDVQLASDSHRVWSSSSDRVAIAAPDGRFLAVGDPDGHVHFIAANASVNGVAAFSEDVSFVGHHSAVHLLRVANSAEYLASVSLDNSVRVWKTASGEPMPFLIEIAGATITDAAFSPDAKYLATLSASEISIVDVASGTVIARFESGSNFSSLAFATTNQLFIGDLDGALQVLAPGVDGNWKMQQVWHGDSAIRLLKASPRGHSLILVDETNKASQFLLGDGRIAEAILQLPANVEQVLFDPSGTRLYFRTARWIHRASVSPLGINWMDALFVHRPPNGAGIVFGDSQASANRIYLPKSRDGYIELLELSFGGTPEAVLFGSKEELLQEWQGRINADPPATSAPTVRVLQR